MLLIPIVSPCVARRTTSEKISKRVRHRGLRRVKHAPGIPERPGPGGNRVGCHELHLPSLQGIDADRDRAASGRDAIHTNPPTGPQYLLGHVDPHRSNREVSAVARHHAGRPTYSRPARARDVAAACTPGWCSTNASGIAPSSSGHAPDYSRRLRVASAAQLHAASARRSIETGPRAAHGRATRTRPPRRWAIPFADVSSLASSVIRAARSAGKNAVLPAQPPDSSPTIPITSLLPDPPVALVLQEAQHGHLRPRRQRVDLVEEQSPPVGDLHEARQSRVRIGEGAALVTEQLALHQRVRQRPAVDRHEGAVASVAPVVDRARRELLAGASLPLDDHRHVVPGDPVDEASASRNAGARPTRRSEAGIAPLRCCRLA